MDNSKSGTIVKNTMMLYLRMAFIMIVSLYTSRIVLQTLGVDDYGINNVVGGTVTFLTFLVYSMNTATQRFLNIAIGKNDEKEVRDVFSASLAIHFFILLLVVVIGEVVGLWLLYNKLVIPADRMNAAFWLFQFTIVSTCTMVMSIPYNAEVIAHEKMNVYAYLSVFDAVLKLLVVYLLKLSNYDKLITFGFLTMCTYILNRVLYTVYCKRTFPECKFTPHFPKKIFKEMLVFAGWDLFGVFAWACATQGATILLNMFFGTLVNAARGIAGTVLGAVKGFSQNFTTALNPAITKAYGAKNYEYMTKLMYSGSKLVFVLLYTLMLPLFIKCHYVLELWLGIVPEYSVTFIRILLVQTLVVTMWTPLFISGLATGKIKSFGLITSCLNIFQVVVCYIILMMGASPEITVMSLGIWEILAYSVQLYTLGKLIDFSLWDYFKKVQVKCIIILGITVLIYYCLTDFLYNNFVNFLLLCVSTTVISLSLTYYILLESSERVFFVSKLKSVIKKH